MYLSVIIPAKNEEKHIGQTVRAVFNYLSKQNFAFEIIPVLNNSKDKSAAIIKDLMVEMPQIKLIDYQGTSGKGYAVRRGMLESTGDYRLFMDADNSTIIDHIEQMMPFFDQGYQVVIGSIRVPGHKVIEGSESWLRIFLGRLSNIYTRIILLPGISDTQRGFKIVTAKAAQDIFSRSKIVGWGFDLEMLALAQKLGYKIKEVPINWHNDPHTTSHPRFAAYIEVFLDTLRIKRDLLLGRYTDATMATATVKHL